MTLLLSRTDVLAVCCVNDAVLVGMGPMLYLYRHGQMKDNVNCLYPNNIHGIVADEYSERHVDSKLAVFGAKSLCICAIGECWCDRCGFSNNKSLLRKLGTDQFNDWIIAAKWIPFKKQTQLAILFAHNYVSIYDVLEKTSRVIRCEEKCILYGGSISGTCQEDLVIFSGTAFQEILIWKIDKGYCDNNTSMPVLHRLTGHKGVVFSVVCDLRSRFICSTSDDRSVRLWEVTDEENTESNNINWQTVKIVPTKALFLHTARVWKALIRNDVVLTIGEDSLVCTWSLSGHLIHKACYKASLWSIDVSEDNTEIYVGGSDGSVCVQSFINCESPETILPSGNNTRNCSKYISYLHDGAMLVFTELGNLLYYDKEMVFVSAVYLTKNGYYFMQVSPNRNMVALASREGYVTVYEHNFRTLRQCKEDKIMNSQILSLHWLSDNELIACGANGLLKLFWLTENNDIKVITECILPSSRERWLTAAIVYAPMSILICGDRVGNIYIYKLDSNRFDSNVTIGIKKPVQTLYRVHGKMGVQSFHVSQKNLITCGRDGMLRFYQMRAEDAKPLLLQYKKKMPINWISGMLNGNELTNKSEDDDILFIFGFKEMEFIIYNMLNENIVVQIPCGGGHRSWDYIISLTKASFAYVKDKEIHVCDLSSFLFPAKIYHRSLQNGFHPKEICCLHYIPRRLHSAEDKDRDILVTGGEDGALRISEISGVGSRNFARRTFKTLGIFNGHISGIKCISGFPMYSRHCSFNYLIFSGGGRAQLKVWGITFRDNGVFCSDLNSHMLYEQKCCKKPWQETVQSFIAEPETRYMDIFAYQFIHVSRYVLLFIACADGYLRLFVYDTITNNLYLKVSTKYVDRCILKISVLSQKSKIVLTMSTDGQLRFFDFAKIIEKIYKDAYFGNERILDFSDIPVAVFSLHQSGINCFDLIENGDLDEDEYLLATGGDDNLLSVICFKICTSEDNQLSAEILSKWSTASAHSAKIVGVEFCENYTIYSVGADQKVIVYDYAYEDNVISCHQRGQAFTSVADVQGMSLYDLRPFRMPDCVGIAFYVCIIYGRGFEILCV
ncbi:PREDICTED: WD repeat-containing protein 6 [Vollenhovia emeryi]|uniref:WD repeat-containing protein 6 n=1 Tax=Vollenhovia emeryi TaxID=411798 RepID=UPI0005F457CB|nr:PREDICTED: WD repeat-containing protein 6 [Vollenhovia emeryi]